MATKEQYLAAARQAKEAGNFDEMEQILTMMEGFAEPAEAAQPQPDFEPPSPFVKGAIRDPLDASAQLLERMLPERAVRSINEFNNWLVEQGLPLAPIPEGGLSQQLREQEQAYQATREPGAGIDWGRLGGTALSPFNLIAASRIPQAAGFGGRVAAGVGGGAAISPLMTPAYGPEEDFWREKGEQAALGGFGGGAGAGLMHGISRSVYPNISPAVRAVEDLGVRMTPGQKLGGMVKSWEDAATSIPILGSVIQRARLRGYQDMNRGVIDQVLGRVGKSLPDDIDTGPRAISFMRSELSKSYDDLLQGMRGELDDTFVQEVRGVLGMAEELPDDIQRYLRSVVKREIDGRATEAGLMSGRSLKEAQTGLTQAIDSIKNPTGWDVQKRDALREIRESLLRMAERVNQPEKVSSLRDLNRAFAESRVINRAASSVGSDTGMFTPAQLYSASKALDRSKDKRAFAEGRGLLQDIAGASKEVLPSQIPDSGTAARMMTGSPLVGAASGLLSLPFVPFYTRPGMAATNALLTSRPGMLSPLATGLGQMARYQVPGSAGLMQEINQ